MGQIRHPTRSHRPIAQLITLQLIGWYGFTQLHCSWLVEMDRSIGWAMSPLPRGTQNKGLAGSLHRLTSTTLRSTDA